MREIRIPAFAKINLRLDVLGKRADGFHELRTIFQTISLHDDLRLRQTRQSAISLAITGNDTLSREPSHKNLVYAAVQRLQSALKMRSGVEITLRKRIPAGRGLGGGSSDAAAALRGYLQLTGKKISDEHLLEIAASLGADVPFFLLGGRAVGVNKGDEIYPLQDIPKLTLLVVSPQEIHVPTPDAYHWLGAPAFGATRRSSQSDASRQGGQLTKSSIPPKLAKFCALCWKSQGNSLSNDFEGPVFQRYPRLKTIKRALLQAGAAEAMLAGSGSAVFGVFPSPALARRAAVGFPHDQTFVCETISRARYAHMVQNAL